MIGQLTDGIIIRELIREEINRELFSHFVRRQEVGLCYRRVDGGWHIVSDPFIDDWTDENYNIIIDRLLRSIARGGVAFGVFDRGRLVGFALIDYPLFGERYRYADLVELHISQPYRGKGIGKRLFLASAAVGRAMGAERLYISAHSALETQLFYEKMGCTDAAEISEWHVLDEPMDRQMEYVL